MTDWTFEIAGRHRRRFQSGGTPGFMHIYLEALQPDGRAFEDDRFGEETAMMQVVEDELVVRAGATRRVVALMPARVRPKSVTIVPNDWCEDWEEGRLGLEAMPDVVLAAIPGRRVHEIFGEGPFKPGTIGGDAVVERVELKYLGGAVWHPRRTLHTKGMVLHTVTPVLDRSKPGLVLVPSCDVPNL